MRATISRAELHAFVRTLGGAPRDVARVEITQTAVTVTSYPRDEHGRRVIADGEPATEVATLNVVGDGDADTVRMRHPGLDQQVDVPASAVGHHAVAGWEVVSRHDEGGEMPSGAAQVTTVRADSALTEEQFKSEPKKSPRRRKNTTEEES